MTNLTSPRQESRRRQRSGRPPPHQAVEGVSAGRQLAIEAAADAAGRMSWRGLWQQPVPVETVREGKVGGGHVLLASCALTNT